jgi:hypothetical protein
MYAIKCFRKISRVNMELPRHQPTAGSEIKPLTYDWECDNVLPGQNLKE